MQRSNRDVPNPAASHADATFDRQVPQEHTGGSNDSQPRDWSQLGRRVMAEAWRRITDDVGTHPLAVAAPAAPAPRIDAEDVE